MHVLTWLRDRGTLTAAAYEGVLHHAQRMNERIEEAILETGALSEAALLKHLASLYGTRFVSTQRLSKATLDAATLALVPRELAERLKACPVVFDRRTQRLSIVVASPGEDDVEKQIQVVSGVREVRSYVARPAAVEAAIAKFYRRDGRAFTELVRREMPRSSDWLDARPIAGPGRSGFDPLTARDFVDPFAPLMGPVVSPPEAPANSTEPADRWMAAAPAPVTPTSPLATPGIIAAEPPALAEVPLELDAYHETLNVLVSLIEQDRGELRGHSAQVARLCRRVAERVGMPPTDRHALLVAAYLHDVGKCEEPYHLTALNVARSEPHRRRAQKSRLAPVKLFAAASLPEETVRILAHQYERFDGQGLPDRLAGKDIPYGARVLALVETYTDLIGNPENPYRRLLSAPQALSVVRDLSGELFDPTLADLLVRLVVGERDDDARETRPKALVVDPDPEELTVLEMRLLEHGFAVSVARDFQRACDGLAHRPDVVVTEVDLGAGSDGFTLAERVAALPEDDRPALIFLTARSDRETVSRGFSLGAADFLVKPAAAEVVATKAGQAVEGAVRQRSGGVSGSLREMSLPDVVQILSNGRRSGRLRVTAGARRGDIHFSEGQIHDARFEGRTGEEAFYALLKLQEGTFHLDPSVAPPERAIHVSPEGLLLEGMRRMDEGLV